LNEVCPKKICILCHQNADPDAICSAFALSGLLKRLIPEVKIQCFSDGLSKVSKKVVKRLRMNISTGNDLNECDLYFLVDTSNFEQLGVLKDHVGEVSEPIIIVDHHQYHPEGKKISNLYIHDDTVCSASEIVYNLYKKLNMIPRSLDAYALLIGITYDSRHFILGTPDTFESATTLMRLGANYEEIIELLRSSLDYSERIARLRAAKRHIIHIIEGWIIIVSNISAFEASVARSLLDLGADIALVASEHKKEKKVRISGRAKRGITRETGLNLGKIFQKIGPLINGEGGGHQNAAACNGTTNLDAGIKEILKLIKKGLIKKEDIIQENQH
ncbi:MAG: bifunctional oligoribonuclease/PAP phosphatase NrnA, partial [Promethearchaeota archaeon]